MPYIWYGNSQDFFIENVPEFINYLNSEELERLNKLKTPITRNRFIYAHLLIRLMLAEQLSVPPFYLNFSRNKWNKPILDMAHNVSKPDFNISYKDDFVACAVSKTGNIGIDIECLQQDIELPEVSEYVLSERELRFLEIAEPFVKKERFFLLWTLKEACLKAEGTGLYISPKSIEFDITSIILDNPKLLIQPGKYSQWHFQVFNIADNYIAAIALKNVLSSSDSITFQLIHTNELLEKLRSFA